jgi:hypothetical protein
MELKPLPIGVQTFRDIVSGGYLYVDKTRHIYELIRYPKGAYFLSRPRRFGKSLLISTLDEIFQGNRALFKGLWLYDSPYQWQQHPVIRIDFSQHTTKSAEELEMIISRTIHDIAHPYQAKIRSGTYTQQFSDLITGLSSQGQVVILIDEYDKPILDNIENIVTAKHIQEVLKGFYTVIKSMDAYVRFVLLTGVSKFSRVGVFSGLNNLNDLTIHPRFHTLLGITQAELEANFGPYLSALEAVSGQSENVLLEKIRLWYNGFCFSKQCVSVYNPFSLLRLFDVLDFQNYWFETGTPTFLLKLIKERGYDLQELSDLDVSELAFSTYEIDTLEIVPLLFQTGYLTIKGYNPDNRRFRLAYPNFEVENAFMAHLLGSWGAVEKVTAVRYLDRLINALLSSDWVQFFMVLNSFLATINYELHIKQEKYYQTIFYLIFKLIGLEIDAEVHTNQGRIDAVIETGNDIYLFEFKLNGSAAKALQQIHEKAYFTRYLATDKQLHLLGVNFEIAQKAVTEWLVA